MTPKPAQPVVHLELHTGDLAHARAYYERLCGWQSERIAAGAGCSYLALEWGDAMGGGIVECRAGRPVWLPYVEVDDVSEVTRQARCSRAARATGGPGRLAQRGGRSRRRRDRVLAAQALSGAA